MLVLACDKYKYHFKYNPTSEIQASQASCIIVPKTSKKLVYIKHITELKDALNR
jgi:hypothetical protein